jgi:hypothetical protein
MSQLYDNHSYPQPMLSLTGVSYLYPAFVALEKEQYYLACSLVFLTSTTILYHGTRWKYFFYLDLIAASHYVGYGAYLSPGMTAKVLYTVWFPFLYGLFVYFVGMKYNIFAFDPDWNTQMFFHGLMHIFSSYSSLKYLESI